MALNRLVCKDIELVNAYNSGIEKCAEILFGRYQNLLNTSLNSSINLKDLDNDDRKSIAYLTFLKAFPKYRGESSFETYIRKCIKNKFLSIYRLQHAKKRIKDLNKISYDSEWGQVRVNRQIYRNWRTQSSELPSLES